jgi:phosphoribosylglycinamide formyltransferase-1
MTDAASSPLPIVVLISGRGSNLDAILDAIDAGELPVEVRAVISNRPDARGLQRPALQGIRTIVIDHACYRDRAAFDRALQATIDTFEPELLVLAGFMRILTPGFVAHYRGRMLNVHPSLLPDFPGLHTHRRALEAGRSEHGASIHFVTEETDGGPVVLQARVPVHADDTPDSLAARVLEQEHRIFPLAIRWFAEHRLALDARGQVLFDGVPLQRPKILTADSETSC